jgi:hypothetical protein
MTLFVGRAKEGQTMANATAGPSTALRFAQDDTFYGGRMKDKQRQVQLQVLRLRCASLRIESF